LSPATHTLCSYNIHGAVGRDGRLDASRIAAVIAETDADFVALQEVDQHPVGNLDLPDYLSSRRDYLCYLGPTLMRNERLFGNMLLSRYPAGTVRRIDLSVPGREPRGAIDIEVLTGHGRLRLINTHLGLRPGERRQQVRRLLAHLEAFNGADLTILTGDLNEWFLWGRPIRWLSRHFSPAPSPATFPTVFPLLALDRIWVAPRRQLLSLKVHKSPVARTASDHLPVCARFSLPPQTAPGLQQS
jgi:endonuclease/exonuclease/phosphatase family metal-dependent hydrolase